MTDETRAPLPEIQPLTGDMLRTAELEEALALAARWCEVRTDESYGQQGKNLGILSRALLEAQRRIALSASGSNWQHFDAAYAKACESSEPKDWMQAALFAQQVRNAVSTTGSSDHDDAERWRAFCNLWAASTEMKVAQDEDGGWSIFQVEDVEGERFGKLTGETPDAAIDKARSAIGRSE